MKNENSDCTSNSDCCQPAKGKLWKKILFVLILFSAVVIVSFKLFGKNDTKPQVNTNTTNAQQPDCCDTTSMKGNTEITQPADTLSCCPKPKK
jgi:hypothetical protein